MSYVQQCKLNYPIQSRTAKIHILVRLHFLYVRIPLSSTYSNHPPSPQNASPPRAVHGPGLQPAGVRAARAGAGRRPRQPRRRVRALPAERVPPQGPAAQHDDPSQYHQQEYHAQFQEEFYRW